MAERAAHLVDRVFPDVPIRQWVLSMPYRLRYRLAWDHDLCRACGRAVRLFDPVAYAAGLLWIVASCAGAALIPALRAARIDPTSALRQD